MPDQPRIPFEASLTDLRSGLESGAFTGTDLVQHFLERIARLDAGKLDSVRQTNPAALEIARTLDLERANGSSRGAGLGALHGIPVLVKDNIDTADQLETTAGSLTMRGHRARADAHLVTRLRAAGAVILGKTNMTEWANFTTTGMPNGYSSLGGQVKNPYGAFDVGGSSSGSGASIAANLAPVAIGTETSGSILSPSVSNSLVGIKPTHGLVSRSGIIPIAASQDTAGPMARCVADAALLLEVIAGVDERDAVTTRQPAPVRYTDFLDADGLRGARLGVPRAYYWNFVTSEQRPVLEGALTALRDGGATVVDDADIESAQAVADLGYTVLLYEFRRDLDAYLRQGEPPYPQSLLEVIRLNEANFTTHLKYGQTLMLAAQTAAGTGSPYYLETRANDLRLSTVDGGIDTTLERHNLDALVLPMYWGAQIGAKAGYPTVTVPCGYGEDGRPVGLSLMGRAWEEAKLIRLAYAFEQLTRARRAPRLEDNA
jgi:amidase